MARLPRLYLPGCAQHVIQRGNNREASNEGWRQKICGVSKSTTLTLLVPDPFGS